MILRLLCIASNRSLFGVLEEACVIGIASDMMVYSGIAEGRNMQSADGSNVRAKGVEDGGGVREACISGKSYDGCDGAYPVNRER